MTPSGAFPLHKHAAPKARSGNTERKQSISFEFFPPKNEKMEAALWQTVERLEPLAPSFVSVTYGAGGSTRERTLATVRRIAAETSLPVAAHLTCVAAVCGEVDAVARSFLDAGIRHIVALRGDPPEGATHYTPHPGGYDCAASLVEGLRRIGEFEISVAAYPEVHPDARSPEADLDNLKRKIDAGATRAITQFFFENETFLRFVDRARAAGIDVPIVPGIMPVTNFRNVCRFASMCGAIIPQWLAERFEGLDDDPETRTLIAASTAVEQCVHLQEQGVDGFHFYTLNRANLSFAICHMLGIRPQMSADQGAERLSAAS